MPVGAAVQEALVDQGPLQLGQSARIDGRLLPELAGQRVEVDIVHRGPGITLRQRLGKLFELGDIGERLGALAHAHRVVAGEP